MKAVTALDCYHLLYGHREARKLGGGQRKMKKGRGDHNKDDKKGKKNNGEQCTFNLIEFKSLSKNEPLCNMMALCCK